MIEYIITSKSKEFEVIDFINEINNDFPIPISKKTNIKNYVKKLFTNGIVISAVNRNKIIGICAGYINDDKKHTAYTSILGVDVNYRKMGIGTNLLNDFIMQAKKNNMTDLMLETHKNNFSAIKMYEKLDFVKQDVKANIEQNIVLKKKI